MGVLSVALIGAGRVGSSLALALARAGHPMPVVVDAGEARAMEVSRAVGAGRFGTTLADELGLADIILMALPDREIGGMAGRLAASGFLRPGQVLCHTSGLLPSSEMAAAGPAGCRLVSMHPMLSFNARFAPIPQQFPVYFGLEGDQAGVDLALELVESLGGIPVRLTPLQKARYHAGCVLATGMTAALLRLSQEVFDGLGLSDDSLGMVQSLAGSALANVMRTDIPRALTGPLVRGDADAVAAHLEALDEADPRAAAAYRLLGRALVETAGDMIEAGARERLRELLKGE